MRCTPPKASRPKYASVTVNWRKQIEASGKLRKQWKQDVFDKLKAAKVYILDPNKTFQPRSAAAAS